MKRKFNLFSYIFSLCATSLLLIVISLAWYVTNNEANVDNGSIATASADGVVLSVNTYSLLDYEGSLDYEYTKGEAIAEMSSYGDASNITAVLLEIEYSISKESNDIYTLKIDGDESAGIISYDDNGDGQAYLSNAVTFTTAELDEKKQYIDLRSTNFKIDKSISEEICLGQIDLSTIEINTTYYEYVVIDYDTNLVNDLYTSLLQSSNKASLNSAIEFVKDLSIILS